MTFPGAFNEEKTHIMAMQLAQAADRWNVPLIVESLPYGYPVTSDDSNNPAIIRCIGPRSGGAGRGRHQNAFYPVHQRTD
ncbi:putative phospho-2-dehydro-3-deoxyheptonate aldolase [Klebsiella pneumoniae]|uniref:Putative phospho-2-dehydro-3-deoxyheptonate aldolase n=1 Tax=Klebsiella pneumoniae TaxID=573 RepID=A0A3S5DHW4_KLEPN|nr:putative phospho-2-dehydro-3-deoxyheptonate aldolase [Klebsiella pneumoniae]